MRWLWCKSVPIMDDAREVRSGSFTAQSACLAMSGIRPRRTSKCSLEISAVEASTDLAEMKAGKPQAAAQPSLSGPRFIIFSVPSSTDCCGALASYSGARIKNVPLFLGGQDHRHCREPTLLDVTQHFGVMSPEVPGCENSRVERQSRVRSTARQQ